MNPLVCQPAETAKHEQLPLIPAHSNVHDSFVDYFGLSYTQSDMSIHIVGYLRRLARQQFMEVDMVSEFKSPTIIGRIVP